VKDDGPGAKARGDLEEPPEPLEARLADLRVDGPGPKIHEGPVECDKPACLAKDVPHGGIIPIRKMIEDGAGEGDLRVDLFPEDLIEMFLEKLIEGDMDLKLFQGVLHRDYPDRHIN
jgi:hypothetical protein